MTAGQQHGCCPSRHRPASAATPSSASGDVPSRALRPQTRVLKPDPTPKHQRFQPRKMPSAGQRGMPPGGQPATALRQDRSAGIRQPPRFCRRAPWPARSTTPKPGGNGFANDSFFTESYYSEPLTNFDRSAFAIRTTSRETLQFFAPQVPWAGASEWKGRLPAGFLSEVIRPARTNRRRTSKVVEIHRHG